MHRTTPDSTFVESGFFCGGIRRASVKSLLQKPNVSLLSATINRDWQVAHQFCDRKQNKLLERNQQKSTSALLAASLVLIGAASRLLPHPPNMTSVGAMGMFSGAKLKTWQACMLTLLCMLITDPILGKIHGYAAFTWGTLIIYGSLLVNVWIGRKVARTGSPIRIGAAALMCGTQFFLITNFGVWAAGYLYPRTIAGLAACYVAAIPFFERTLAGDLVYTAIFFGVYALANQRIVGSSDPAPVGAH